MSENKTENTINPTSGIDVNNMDEPSEIDKKLSDEAFTKSIIENITRAVRRIETDETTIAMLISIKQHLEYMASSSAVLSSNPITQDDMISFQKEMSESSQTIINNITKLLSCAVTMATFEGVGFFNDMILNVMENQNMELVNILNDHMARIETQRNQIEVLQKKISDMETTLMIKEVEDQIEV